MFLKTYMSLCIFLAAYCLYFNAFKGLTGEQASATLQPKYKKVYLGKGRISSFGGPNDPHMTKRPTAITGVPGKELDPDDLYCAFKWNYKKHSKELLKNCLVEVVSLDGRKVYVDPIDWGPKKRFIDVSPKAMKRLGVETDDKVEAFLLVPITEQEEQESNGERESKL